MDYAVVPCFLFTLLSSPPSTTPPDTATAFIPRPGAIQVSAQLSAKEVPLNRYVTLEVRAQWEGDLNRFEIADFGNPTMTNLQIVGTSSSNRVGEENGKAMAIKEYEFTLKPLELGMAYIDGVTITYKDAATGQEQRLATQRLDVKVVEPVAEPESHSWIAIGAMGVAAVSGVGGLGLWWYRKRERDKREREKIQPLIPLEESYLRDLKSLVQWDSPNLRESFAAVSRLLRRYLNQKHGITALEATTGEILEALRDLGTDERVIGEVLETCDTVKFGGQEATRPDLERVYTLVEGLLERNRAASLVQ